MKYQHAIVVGATSGIGREIARQLAASGTKVAALGRRTDLLDSLKLEFPDRIECFVHDVSRTEVIPELFADITLKLGGLDLFVYSTGIMPITDWNSYRTGTDIQMIDTNVTGAVAWCNEAAQRFAGTKHGTIIGIGSVAGERGRGMQPVYNASKAFLHTYLEALRNRLCRHGIVVVTIKPGPVATEMTRHMDQTKMISAETAAKISLRKASRSGEYFLNPVHAVLFLIIRNLPSFVLRRLKI